MIKIINGKKYYPVSERLLFGLESMYEKCMTWYECEFERFTDEQLDLIWDKKERCEELLNIARSTGYVDGKTFGEIKEITEEREWMRYRRCIESGMSERDAAYALG